MGNQFAHYLSQQGWSVEVVTGFPNYPEGKLYSGYKLKLYSYEKKLNYSLHRLYLFPDHSHSKIKRALNYISFGISSFIFLFFKVKKGDILYVYHPPLTTGVTAALLVKLRGIKFCYDVQDIWPDSLKSTSMINEGLITKIISNTCNFVYTQASQIRVLSEGFLNLLVERGVSEKKINIIHNWALNEHNPKTDFDPDTSVQNEFFKIIYAGNIGYAQSLDTLLDAACETFRQGLNIEFYIIGAGVCAASLNQRIIDEKISNCHIKDVVPLTQLNKILNSSDALILHLIDDSLFQITIPSKLQSYMCSGNFILNGVKGEASSLVEKSRCGLSFEPQNHLDLVNKIKLSIDLGSKKRKEMGSSGREFYLQNLSSNIGYKKLSDLFHSM
jgi:glycosyltransferase involved in cell wall biosynthesis